MESFLLRVVLTKDTMESNAVVLDLEDIATSIQAGSISGNNPNWQLVKLVDEKTLAGYTRQEWIVMVIDGIVSNPTKEVKAFIKQEN